MSLQRLQLDLGSHSQILVCQQRLQMQTLPLLLVLPNPLIVMQGLLREGKGGELLRERKNLLKYGLSRHAMEGKSYYCRWYSLSCYRHFSEICVYYAGYHASRKQQMEQLLSSTSIIIR